MIAKFLMYARHIRFIQQPLVAFVSAVSLVVVMDTKDIYKPAHDSQDLFRLAVSTYSCLFLKVQ